MSETQDKLNWQAFRYIANELDATETREFESLLMADQMAREAVSLAVKDAARIRQALARPVVVAASRQSSWNQKTTRVAVVAVGSCLTLLVALCLVRSSLPNARGLARQTVDNELSNSPAQLAYAWAEARGGLTESQPAAPGLLTDSLDGVLMAAIESRSEQSLVAPSWMLAALAKMDVDSEIEFQE